MAEVIASDNPELLSHFVLTIGVVSNHGNWFTSENHNKELKVLAQSYDWLLFLTDAGIAQFIDEVLLHPKRSLRRHERRSWQATREKAVRISSRRSKWPWPPTPHSSRTSQPEKR